MQDVKHNIDSLALMNVSVLHLLSIVTRLMLFLTHHLRGRIIVYLWFPFIDFDFMLLLFYPYIDIYIYIYIYIYTSTLSIICKSLS